MNQNRKRDSLGKHSSSQSELRVIGATDDVILVTERQHADHWTKDLLACHRHLVGDVIDDARTDVPAVC